MELTKELGFQYGFAGTMLAIWLGTMVWLVRRLIPKAEAGRDAAIRQMVKILRSTLRRQSEDCLVSQREQQRVFTHALSKLEQFWAVELRHTHAAHDRIIQELIALREQFASDKPPGG